MSLCPGVSCCHTTVSNETVACRDKVGIGLTCQVSVLDGNGILLPLSIWNYFIISFGLNIQFKIVY